MCKKCNNMPQSLQPQNFRLFFIVKAQSGTFAVVLLFLCKSAD